MQTEKEIFKPIVGVENLYEVSNLGRVRSLGNGGSLNPEHQKERMLRPCKSSTGYFTVCLYKNGNRRSSNIHRLVAIAFISNPNKLLQVNHKNSIKTDDRVGNLEWCSRRYDRNHFNQTRKTSSKYPGVHWRRRNEKWVSQIAVKGRRKHLGYFINELDAAEAYQKAVDELKSEGVKHASEKERDSEGTGKRDSLGKI